jgi:hypothetical protein
LAITHKKTDHYDVVVVTHLGTELIHVYGGLEQAIQIFKTQTLK